LGHFFKKNNPNKQKYEMEYKQTSKQQAYSIFFFKKKTKEKITSNNSNFSSLTTCAILCIAIMTPVFNSFLHFFV